MSLDLPRWSCTELADTLQAGLAAAVEAIELEQPVRGLDASSELALHPLLHRILRDAGHGVHPEQRYPGDRGKRKRSEGLRCDLVLTPAGRPLVGDEAQLGLFASQDPVALRDALWIEVKVVAQFRELLPNRAYEQALLGPVWKDVLKLARDPGIVHAMVLLILFTADAPTATHDLDLWALHAHDAGLPLRRREQRSVPLRDRAGNTLCTVALFRLDPVSRS